MPNSKIELLIELGVSDTSRDNINQYIKSLKNLDTVKIDLQVNGLNESQKTIQELQTQIQKINKTISKSNNNEFKVDTSTAKKELKSLMELTEDTVRKNGTLKINEDIIDGKKTITSIVQTFTNAKNEVEKIRFNPHVVLDGRQLFEKVKSSLDNVGNVDFTNALKKFENELEKLQSKGFISKNEKLQFVNEASLKNSVKEVQEFQLSIQKIGQNIDSFNKIKNATESTKESLVSLNDRLNLTLNKLGDNVNTSKLEYIQKKILELSNLQIVDEADIQKANSLIDSLSRRITSLGTDGNSMQRFNNIISQSNELLNKMTKEGFASSVQIENLRKSLDSVNAGDIQGAKNALKDIKKLMSDITYNIELDKGIMQVTNGVSRLQTELTKTVNLYKKSVDQVKVKELETLILRISKMPLMNTQQIREAQIAITNVKEEIKRLNAEATAATRNSMGIIESFNTAMSKFPVWMAASTIFYSSINSAKEFMRIIVDIDTKLTDISKVMSDNFDVATVLDNATESANRFGKSISETLDAYIEFARQGYKAEDLQLLSNAGLVASNVGELSAQEASEFMTASMAQWNMESSQAMSIIDSWNSISNNYATTVKKLAEGQAKAGATAKALGVDFDQLNAIIGTVTAKTKQSGSEIGNFVKAVLPRLASDTGLKTLEGLGISLTDSAGNIRDVIEVYTEVAEKIKTMSEIEQANVLFGLGGTYHRTRLQALLDDLGSVDSMYRSMYETSSNSSGSAVVENEKYMQSLQARINSMKVEIEELALAIGNAFLTDGMTTFMETSMDILKVITKLVDEIGALPILFMTMASGITLFSSNAKNAVSTIIGVTSALTKQTIAKMQNSHADVQYSSAVNKAIVANGNFTKSTNTASTAVRTLSVSKKTASLASAQFNTQLASYSRTTALANASTKALSVSIKTLGTSLAAGLPFLAIGLVVEQLMKASAETRELKESALSANTELTESYKSNKDEINSLVGKYEELEQVISSNDYDLETLNEYYDVQNKIGQLMPRLVTGEDEYGNKLVESSTAIKDKLAVLEQQIELEKELSAWQEKQNRDKRIEGNDKLIDDNLGEFQGKLTNLYSSVISSTFYKNITNDISDAIAHPEVFKSLEDVKKYLEKVRDARNEAELSGNTKMVEYYNKLAQKISDATSELNGYESSMKQAQSANRIDYISKLNDTLEGNTRLSKSAKEKLQSFSSELMRLSDISDSENLNNALNKIFLSVENNSDISNSINGIISEFSKLENASEENFNSIVSKIEGSIDDVEDKLASFGLSDTEIASVIDVLNKKLDTTKTKFSEASVYAKENGVSLEEAKIAMSEYGDVAEDTSNSLDEFADKLKNLTNNISNINGILEDYNETGKISTKTMLDLIATYPSLINYIGDEASFIQELTRLRDEDVNTAKQQIAEKLETSETFYNNNIKLLEEYVNQHFKFYDGDLKQFKTLAKAKADVETELITNLAKKWGVYYSQQLKSFSVLPTEETQSKNSFGLDMNLVNDAMSAQKELNDFYKQWENFSLDKIDLDFSSIGTSLDDVSKATKDANSATKESIYITDKYKQKLEALNLAIEKAQHLQSQHPKYSAKYRQALQSEIKLQQQKLELINAQTKALDAQIKSGKIAQTGTVSDAKSGSTTVAKTSTIKSGGAWTGRLTSKQGNRVLGGKSEYHRGIDIASPQGTKLIANIAGKVIASGSATSQGYHSSYGNIVVVQDNNGNKHLYAHLSQAIAKLGSTIEKGATLGKIGSTGRSTGSHLHYEVSNSSGKLQDAASFAKEARTGTMSVNQQITETVKAVDNSQQAIDEAKSTLLSLQSEALAQQEKIAQLQQAIMESTLAMFDYKRDNFDSNLSHEVAKLKTLDKESVRYNKTLDLMTRYMEQKQQVNQDELAYIDDLIAKGGLSEITIAELTSRKLELKTAIHDLNNEIQQFKLDNLTKQYEDSIDDINDKIAYQEAKLQHLNTSSERYTQTLRNIAGGYEESSRAVQNHINDLQKLIDTQQVSGDNLDATIDKINDLKVELENLHKQIMDKNYEVIVNIKTQYDEQTDDLQFEIDRSKAIMGMYEEGTANYNSELQKQIELTKKQKELYDQSRREIQKEMNQTGLNAEQKKELMEQMEDLSLSYNNAEASIRSMTKALEDSNESMLESIADAYIDAYKEYVREINEEHMNMLDEQAEAEQDAYEKRKQLMEDEMDEFRKNVEEKLRLIRRQEDERSYQKDLDKMEKEREDIVRKINLLSLDNSYEAKKKREALVKELTDIDNEIAEHKHARDIELQEQALNDLLEQKEEEFEIKQEYNDKEYDATVKLIDRQREYWQKYYRDLENDERKFAQIREDILNGHFDKVNAEFESMIAQLEATMPRLVDTLDGTMQGVGTAIRQNVIDQLREAMKMVDDYTNKMNSMSDINVSSKFEDNFDPNAGKSNLPTSTSPSDGGSGQNTGDKIKGIGDIKVVVGKYMTDVIANKEPRADRAATIRDKAHALAAEGRAQGSKIVVNQHVNDALKSFSAQDIENIKDYVYGNASDIFQTDYLQNWLTDWAASLDTGGYLNFGKSSGGLDGKGGKAIIAHDGEVVLNKVQTNRLLDNIEVSDGLLNKITSMASMFSNIISGMSNALSIGGGYGDITVNFGDVHNATQEQAENFATQFINRINTRRGGF